MIDENQPGAAASVSEVTNACCRGGWQYALQVLGRIRNHHIEPTVESFNAISSSCEKVTRRVDDDSWKFSVQCLASASSKSLKASLISYNTAIATFGQGLHWYYSLSVFLSLQQHGFTPDDFSVNSLATACEKKFRWEAAVETLRLHRWCKVDVIGMNAVISACGNNGQWQAASTVLMDLFRKGISSSQISFAATASACEKANLWMRPLQLLRSGKAIAQLGPVIHGIVLDAMEKQGLWEETLAHFRLFRDLRLTLKDQMDPISVSAAVSACRENWRQTLFLTAEGIRHFPKGMSTEAWNACIHSCVGHVPILKLLEWMKASQFEPDMLSYAALDKPGLNLIAGSDTTELLIKTRLEAVAALRRLCFSKKRALGVCSAFQKNPVRVPCSILSQRYVPNHDSSFVYDRVFGSEATQKEAWSLPHGRLPFSDSYEGSSWVVLQVYDYAAKPIINGVFEAGCMCWRCKKPRIGGSILQYRGWGASTALYLPMATDWGFEWWWINWWGVIWILENAYESCEV